MLCEAVDEDSSLSTGNVQYRIGLKDSRFDGGFLTFGEVGYMMENLVDRVGTFNSVSYPSLRICSRCSPADNPESCTFAGSPAGTHVSSMVDYWQMTFTSKFFNVLLNPLQCEPLILEPKIPVDLGLIACKETKHRKSVSNVNPDL